MLIQIWMPVKAFNVHAEEGHEMSPYSGCQGNQNRTNSFAQFAAGCCWKLLVKRWSQNGMITPIR